MMEIRVIALVEGTYKFPEGSDIEGVKRQAVEGFQEENIGMHLLTIHAREVR